MDQTGLASDSGYGSELHGKMASRQGPMEDQYLGPNLETTNELYLPMPGSWHNDYREPEYAPSVSVMSGLDMLPDQTLQSPSDYSMDHNIGQQHDNDEALVGAGSFLGLSMSQLDVSTSSTLNFSASQQDTNPVDFAPEVTTFVDAFTMKRTQDFDTFEPPHKKSRSISHRSNPPYGTLSSPDSSHPLTRNMSSGAHSSQYPAPFQETFDQDPTQSQSPDLDWQTYHQPALSSIGSGSGGKRNSTTEKSKREKNQKKHRCVDGCIDKGFTTTNDLERHRRTVHNKINVGDKVWLCTIGNCSAGRKVWARMDNFKQHISRMHNQGSLESVEQMAVSYNPKLHDLQAGKKKMIQGYKETPTDNPVETTTHALNTPVVFNSPPRAGWSREPTMGNTSRENRSMPKDSNLSSTSLFFDQRSLQAQQRSSQSQNINRQPQRKSPATVANPESLAHQGYEMRTQDSTPISAFPPRSTQHDLLSVTGPDSAPGFEGNVFPAQIELGQFGKPEKFSPRVPLIRETDMQQLVENLSPEEQTQLRNLLNQCGASTSQTRQRSASTSKLQTIKKTDSVKDEMTLICSKAGCGKKFSKNAELRKHEARHARKYFCTFDECFKKFGTKWEWKRHERSQHTQSREWRCNINNLDKVCGQVFSDETKFRSHLGDHHRITESAPIQQTLGMCLLSKNWIGSFWCGFCAKIIHKPKLLGTDSLKARYEHIADHIDSKQRACNMSHWIEIHGGGRTKMEIQQTMDGGLNLQSPSSETGNSTTPTERNEEDSLDEEEEEEDDDENYESEEDSGQDNDAVDAQRTSLHVSTARATASQTSHSQSDYLGTQNPEITLTPPGHHETQANFMGEQFYDTSSQQQIIQTSFGNHDYASQFARICNTCGSVMVPTPTGDYCTCQYVHMNHMSH